MKRFLQGILIALVATAILYFASVYVPAVFKGEIIVSPIAFTILGFDIRWYGFLIALSVLISYFITASRFEQNKISTRVADNVILVVILFGLIGARIGFVVQSLHFYFANPIQIIEIWSGGLSIHGAILGGILGLLVCAKLYKIKFIKIANIVAPQVMLAGAIGRWGNFFNYEIFGRPATIFWKMFVPVANRPIEYGNSSFFHPVFLYESILLFAAFGAYLLIRKKVGDRLGFSYTLIIYSLIRIIVEFWRIDYKPIFSFLDLGQLVSIGIVLVGVAVILSQRTK